MSSERAIDWRSVVEEFSLSLCCCPGHWQWLGGGIARNLEVVGKHDRTGARHAFRQDFLKCTRGHVISLAIDIFFSFIKMVSLDLISTWTTV
jgi:hypothetical protein